MVTLKHPKESTLLDQSLLESISEECVSQAPGSVIYQFFKVLGIFFDIRHKSCRSSEII